MDSSGPQHTRRWQLPPARGRRASAPQTDRPAMQADLVASWHRLRAAAGAGAILVGAGAGSLWGWLPGFMVAAMGALALADAHHRRRQPGHSPTLSLVLDTTLIGYAMFIVQSPLVAMGMALAYLIASVLLILPLRRALPALSYVTLWTVLSAASAEFVDRDPLPASGQAAVGIVSTLALAGFLTGLVVMVARSLVAISQARERRLRYEKAISECARTLLEARDEGALDAALGALLEAVPAQNVFVDENVHHPELGLCARVTHEAIKPEFGSLVSEEIWDEPGIGEMRTQLPYGHLPTTFAALSQGKAVEVFTSQLQGEERKIYEEDGCKSELNIPILVEGEWVGSIGFADYLVERTWEAEDVQLLHAAAAMIGAFWERSRAQRRLEELIRSKDEFVASISHELRTPLTSVLGFALLLHEGTEVAPGEHDELLHLLTQGAREVSNIVDDLLVAARAEIGTLSLALQPVQVAKETRAVINALPEGSQRIRVEGEEVAAWADPARARQIIRNLLTNAVRYGGESIRVRTTRYNGRVLLSVVDDGPGIPEAQRDAIFEPYHRAHRLGTQPESVGLGLTVSRQLARLMAGDLTYRFDGDHSIFELVLPASAPPHRGEAGTTRRSASTNGHRRRDAAAIGAD